MLKELKKYFSKLIQANPHLFFNSVDIPASDSTGMIKIVPVGYFPEHPEGAHEITYIMIKQMADNLKKGGTDLLFDYGHESVWNGGAKAAGWSSKLSAEARPDGLYVSYPEFTPPAEMAIKNREYRYFSPAYWLNTKDKLGEEKGAQLKSVALTNTPYMDTEIDHIGNSNISLEDPEMKFSKSFLEKYDLNENSTEAEIEAKINAVVEDSAVQVPPDKSDEIDPKIRGILNGIQDEIKILKEDRKLSSAKAAEALVDLAINDGKILPADKDVWLSAALADFSGTQTKLASRAKNSVMPQHVTVNQQGESEKKNSIKAAADFFKSQGRTPLLKSA